MSKKAVTKPDTQKRRRRTGRPPTGTPDWRPIFLKELRKRGNIADACAAAKVARQTAYGVRKEEPGFKIEWEDALNDACDRMESEAFRRAVEGCRKPVYQSKELVGFIQEYSDTLLIFLLKAHRPKFRDASSLVSFDARDLTDEQLERIAAGENPLVVLASPSAGGAGTPPTSALH
jgi:hypothetical protein